MNIHEYQGKAMFRKAGVNVLDGVHCTSIEDALSAYDSLGSKVVAVKSQIHAGGRGKGTLYSPESGEKVMEGGVKIAFSREDVELYSRNILGNKLVTIQTGENGKIVNNLYVEAGCAIAHEYYLAILVDREAKAVLIMASTEGGMDIEKVAENTPEALHKVWVDPAAGLLGFQKRNLGMDLGLSGAALKSFFGLLGKLYDVFVKNDCAMVEINPLVRSEDDEIIALDAKVSFDENASFRHKEWEDIRDLGEEDDAEVRAKELGLSYVKLDGDIGCLVNGAGLAMATMDVIQLYGGEPANFLDLGGGAGEDTVNAAFEIILEDHNVKGILVNIFGGIQRCDVVANGVLASVERIGLEVPLVIRLSGTNYKEGRAIIDASDLQTYSVDTLAEGAKKIVELIGGES
ncbi:MAG: ADP-forming succinate--CoA ligase subunit beta [Euryarchaeota archaeon]|jgi:succinyl-CoA synthetase beta subunit|nr:ADP-forming succinate--CoA ligase subunit beta [Euryarchaeota archaeon]MBT3653349.1 ADP-forming succinate--CoA ligase subunit beta [Euryarchaeota archaeon]MBT3758217.1 ADP-forming succinate--CoA ligase subunit beta [Euryarchaeota archaeon]MBT4051326.1 ADP-forming succinate--CoA ligase subunit beta [Euryarchaeota archaeon]MBT4346323.1 ADP-forming succinate--CoA ligase subunit beta [Euryarchaeota archaeon]